MVAELAATRQNVTGAIRNAARVTGANFQYLLATAKVESNLDPNAAVRTSSARGLFQFIEQTWLATLKENGPALGYGQFSQAIERMPSGQYAVRDPRAETAILNLRSDPTANAVMAGAHTRENALQLQAALGRNPTEGELYIAHFLGVGGAGRLIGMAGQTPHTRAADVFPSAARANPSIFHDRQGQARSVSQVYSVLVGRYEQARANGGAQPSAPAAIAGVPFPLQQTGFVGNVASPAAAQSYAATARRAEQPQPAELPPAQLGDNGPAFHGLFSTPRGRRDPISPAVSTLWGVPAAPPPVSTQNRPSVLPEPALAAPIAPTQNGAVQNGAPDAPQPLFQDSQPDARALFRGRV